MTVKERIADHLEWADAAEQHVSVEVSRMGGSRGLNC